MAGNPIFQNLSQYFSNEALNFGSEDNFKQRLIAKNVHLDRG